MPVEEVIHDFQKRCRVCYLATCDQRQPRVRPMSPLAVEGNTIYMAAYASSGKIGEISSNPNVEVCYMDEKNRHIRCRGTAEIVNEPDLKRRLWQANRYVQAYFASPRDPGFALLKIDVVEALLMEADKLEYDVLEV